MKKLRQINRLTFNRTNYCINGILPIPRSTCSSIFRETIFSRRNIAASPGDMKNKVICVFFALRRISSETKKRKLAWNVATNNFIDHKNHLRFSGSHRIPRDSRIPKKIGWPHAFSSVHVLRFPHSLWQHGLYQSVYTKCELVSSVWCFSPITQLQTNSIYDLSDSKPSSEVS